MFIEYFVYYVVFSCEVDGVLKLETRKKKTAKKEEIAFTMYI